MLLVDPPKDWIRIKDAKENIDSLSLSRNENAAIYFPLVRSPDPEEDGRYRNFAPCGVVAGVIARTDAQRGIWKAPAGIDAILTGVPELKYQMTDEENGSLNPLGINCLRVMPGVGRVVWGARTLKGADRLANQWKYLPVRRTALYIEESLYRGTQWAVFEPNDEPLWAQIRLNVGAFMHDLFTKGAFQGSTPKEAYLVKCDKETTTQYDIDRGIVNIVVGFAPLKPAEFVMIKIQQLAGQREAQ
jgi:phage tail sheath protein FI